MPLGACKHHCKNQGCALNKIGCKNQSIILLLCRKSHLVLVSVFALQKLILASGHRVVCIAIYTHTMGEATYEQVWVQALS